MITFTPYNIYSEVYHILSNFIDNTLLKFKIYKLQNTTDSSLLWPTRPKSATNKKREEGVPWNNSTFATLSSNGVQTSCSHINFKQPIDANITWARHKMGTHAIDKKQPMTWRCDATRRHSPFILTLVNIHICSRLLCYLFTGLCRKNSTTFFMNIF